jgi:hypothetical protein
VFDSLVQEASGGCCCPRSRCGSCRLAPSAIGSILLVKLRRRQAESLLRLGARERVGHSRVALTLDVYSHVIPGMQEDAVSRIDAAFAAALTKRG